MAHAAFEFYAQRTQPSAPTMLVLKSSATHRMGRVRAATNLGPSNPGGAEGTLAKIS